MALECHFRATPLYIFTYKDGYLMKAGKATGRMSSGTDATPVLFVWILAVLLLVSAGIAYRVPASHLKLLFSKPIKLPVPLSDFPKQIGNWVGNDLPIPAITREYMEKNFADDFFSRRYINSATQTWADVYVVYCSSQPGAIRGHRPRVCYAGHGWVHDSTKASQFVSQAGREIDCSIHKFHKGGLARDEKVVLSFYISNGRIAANESGFLGLFSRRPNISRNPGRYIAQVQISSVLENSIRTIAKDITDLVLDYLPDKNGHVRAVEYSNVIDSVLK